MIQILILLDIISTLIHGIEAAYESSYQDRKHWPSVIIVYSLIFILHVIFLGVPGTFYERMIISLVILSSFVIGRIFFDYMYNKFERVHWAYLGSSRFDDFLMWLRRTLTKDFTHEDYLRGYRRPLDGAQKELGLRIMFFLLIIGTKYSLLISQL